MTAYLACKECAGPVPWYYAHRFKRMPHQHTAHPYCFRDTVDEEGAGATIAALIIAWEQMEEW